MEREIERELVLKIFREADEQDKKSFYKEVEVIKAMLDLQRNRPDLVKKHARANEAVLEGTAYQKNGPDDKEEAS